jgi:ribose transport system substrate-binding protein
LKRIGVLYWSATIEGQRAMRRGVEREAQRLTSSGARFELVPSVAGDGADGKARQVEQMVLGPQLRRANAAGIPVVAWDQYIEEGTLAAFVTSDNAQAGRLDGEYIANRFPAGHNIRLVLVEYPPVSSTVERLDAFLAALERQGRRHTILATYEAVEPVAGAQAGAQLLRDFPQRGSVDAVFTVNDGGGLAVVEALKAAGRTEILVATVDGDPKSVENIRSGTVTVIDAAQFCGPLGEAAMHTMWQVLEGKPVPRRRLVSTFPVTAETLARYPGWDGPLPAPFTLPWPSQTATWTAGDAL